MSLPKFTYVAPRSIKEASALLMEYGDKARLMAGGTDLLIRMRHRAMSPEYVIGLRHLTGLDRIAYSAEKGLIIGALAKLADVAGHPDVEKHFPALAQSASVTATVQIRNMGTLAGNICNAAPSADNATPLLAHDAEVLIVHPGGERRLPLREFFRGPGLTALEPGEIVKEIRVPPPGSVAGTAAGSDYQKISARSKVDIAAVGVAALAGLDDEGSCRIIRIALGAVAPIPMRAVRAEEILAGKTPTPELIREAALKAAEESSPISDVRASVAYRRKMVEVLTMRAVENSVALAARNQAGCDI